MQKWQSESGLIWHRKGYVTNTNYPVCIKLNQISSPTLVDEPFEKLSRLSLRILRLTLHHHPQLKLKKFKKKIKKKLFWIFDLNQLFILSQISVFILTACFWGVLLQ